MCIRALPVPACSLERWPPDCATCGACARDSQGALLRSLAGHGWLPCFIVNFFIIGVSSVFTVRFSRTASRSAAR